VGVAWGLRGGCVGVAAFALRFDPALRRASVQASLRGTLPGVTLLCAPILVEEAGEALEAARRARLAGAEMVEWRVDPCFHGEGDDEGEALCMRLCAESPLPCVLTCRDRAEGGEYTGDDAAKIALYERLGTSDHPPAYFDLEFALWRRSANLRQKARLALGRSVGGAGLILSAHDFDGRPANLSRLVAEMRAVEAASVLKIAWRARSLRDNLEAFDLLRERDRPTIALCMGEFGLMSRVLAPKFGGFLTFASLGAAGATAPGQPTIDELLNLYRFRSIGASTRVCGVIGWPVGHSRSPALHNGGFEAARHDGVYLPLPVAEGWEPLKATLHALADSPLLNFAGASVTIPHKGHAARFCAETEGWTLEDDAARIGAVNTLAREGDAWRGSNTDAPAVAACLREAMGGVEGRRVLVLGAGGAARAAAGGVLASGGSVVLCARGRARAEAIRDDFQRSGWAGVEVVEWRERAAAASAGEVGAIVHCTPIGMRGGPAPEESPLPEEAIARVGASCVVFDTVYAPPETPLLRAARARGLPCVVGGEMFIRQGAAQFRQWTGRPAPLELFRRIIRESA